MFQVKTESFEGPLELLLSLIEKRKLFINDISLAAVTDDYIQYLENAEKVHVGHNAHFILIASTLLLIKSKSLLPTLELTAEEQGSVDDLTLRLKEYQRIKELSVHIQNRFGSHIQFPRESSRTIPVVFVPEQSITTINLRQAMQRVLQSLPKIEKLPHIIVKKVISLEEMIEKLSQRVSNNIKMSFSSFSGKGKEDKVNVIVSFLAMLELVKNGLLHVQQEQQFGDIDMETRDIGIPSYQ